ncbi:hypothetical protein G6514_005519 [Epicoccum nigrum]|nr:hypothetical protein G6514_005519 [Epicoccum nigrum]
MGSATATALNGGLILSILLCIYSLSFKNWIFVFVTVIALHNRYGYGLSNFAGPTAASLTTLWRARHIKQNWTKRPTFAKLHEEYGEISQWYTAWEAHGKGAKKENIFSTRDIHWHARYRKHVEGSYEMSQLKRKESEIDGLVGLLLSQLDDSSGKLVDLPRAIHYFTFDAGGVFSFSRPFGFLKKRGDIDGILKTMRNGAKILHMLAYVPLAQMWIDKNPMAVYFGFIAPPMRFAKKYIPYERIEEEVKQPEHNPKHNDILDTYIAAIRTEDGVVSQNEIVDLALMIVVPNPEAVKDTIASWDTASKLPYLDACIKESMRLQPPTGFLMERVVPSEGAVICGEFIPGGTTVGCVPWVMHRHRPTFGDDVENFRPERWIEAPPEQRAAMDKVWCPFGFQSRLCMGMNMGLFELYKITATLLNRYQIDIEAPNKDMEVTWANIVNVDYNARLTRR